MAHVADHHGVAGDPIEDQISKGTDNFHVDASLVGFSANAGKRSEPRHSRLDRRTDRCCRVGVVLGDTREDLVGVGVGGRGIEHSHAP